MAWPFSFWGEFCCFHSWGCSAAPEPDLAPLGSPWRTSGWKWGERAGEGVQELEKGVPNWGQGGCRSWGRHFGTRGRDAVTEMGCRNWKTGYRAGEGLQGWERVSLPGAGGPGPAGAGVLTGASEQCPLVPAAPQTALRGEKPPSRTPAAGDGCPQRPAGVPGDGCPRSPAGVPGDARGRPGAGAGKRRVPCTGQRGGGAGGAGRARGSRSRRAAGPHRTMAGPRGARGRLPPPLLLLLPLLLPLPAAPAAQSCLSRQQLLAAIRQMQQLLKGQETRFSEGLRAVRSRLSTIHASLAKAAPEPPAATCPALQAPADGRKFGTKYLVDHEVHFACDPGFQLLGSSTRMCQANGSWTGQEARCAEIRECSSSPCQNGGTCLDGLNHFKCLCPPQWTGTTCQYQAQTAPPTWSVTDDPAFSRQPRCAQIAQTQQCSCDPGFHMSGTASNGICQDLNECEVYQQQGGPRLCAHACVNIPGSFRCSCPAGYVLLGDGKSCEDIDECSLSQDNCTSGSTCINTGGGFQCVTPQCPPAAGNVSYVKTSPFQCERNPCPMESRSCHQAPKTISFHYLPLPSKLQTPAPLFRMATAAAPGRPGPDSLRFGIAGGNNRGHFVVQRSDRHTGELLLVQSLRGPRTVHVDVDMAEYLDRVFQAKHLSKITLFVSAYEF